MQKHESNSISNVKDPLTINLKMLAWLHTLRKEEYLNISPFVFKVSIPDWVIKDYKHKNQKEVNDNMLLLLLLVLLSQQNINQ